MTNPQHQDWKEEFSNFFFEAYNGKETQGFVKLRNATQDFIAQNFISKKIDFNLVLGLIGRVRKEERQATIRECIESAPKKLNLDEEKERFRTDDILELQEYIGGHNSAISDYQQALKDKLK
jgi:hypothetical protein